jgi:hypothetical protein
MSPTSAANLTGASFFRLAKSTSKAPGHRKVIGLPAVAGVFFWGFLVQAFGSEEDLLSGADFELNEAEQKSFLIDAEYPWPFLSVSLRGL